MRAPWQRFRVRRRRPDRRGCRACGVCCELYGHALWAEPADVERWRAAGRFDLVQRVGAGGEIWVDPATGAREETCPFLRRTDLESARCAIHALKPAVCRAYPTRAHRYRCVRGRVFEGEG